MDNLENKVWLVYKHTLILDCPSYGKSYIGITCQDTGERWKNGLGYYNQTFYLAIKKYGWENFSHDILENNIATLEEANEREKYWIAYYHTYTSLADSWGYNASPGGNCSRPMTEEEKVAHRQRMLDRHYIPTTETREKISKANKGKKRSDETKQKLSIAKTGIKLSEEHKKHLSEAQKKVPIEKRLCPTRHGKQIICIETGVIYISQSAAARETGISLSSIRGCLKHYENQHTAGGFHWEYINNNDNDTRN